MSKPISFGELDFKIVASMDETRREIESETPFRICILGDFSGRANCGTTESGSVPADLRPIEIDRDNIDEVMSKLGVEVHLSFAGNSAPSIKVKFSELDDFHPDQLYSRVDVFQTLRDTRKRLNDLRTFESAKKEVQSWMGLEETEESLPEQPASTPLSSSESSGGLLDQIVGEAEDRIPDEGRLADPSGWDSFMKNIVGPHLVPGNDTDQEELVASVDAAVSGLMDTILHHPDFQDIEAAWRALRFLVFRVETDAQLKVYLVDISRAELAADLGASEDLQSSGIYNLLVTQTVGTPGGEPWAVLAGNYTFDQTPEDAETLGRMAKIASHAGAPFISAAHSHVLGCESLVETPDPNDWKRLADPEDVEIWDSLRGLPEASYLGLVMPRFLLRLPYGKDTDPVDYFDFEEMNAGPVHEKYLWGNPSFACVLLLAQAFTHYEWDLSPGNVQDIKGLPLHIYKAHDETIIKPCAEVMLSERAAENILDKGIMALASFQNQDSARLIRFQSLADPLAALSGRWG